jgi:uncharacterized protein (TIGR02646 family)
MKHIAAKHWVNEPNDFKDYRENTPNAAYDGGNFSVPALLDALLEEQGYICAYCMGKLTKREEAHVEHYWPRQSFKSEELDYINLLAVCNGLTQSHPEKEDFHHCDKTKGTEGKMDGTVTLRLLDPREKSKSEDRLTYTLAGQVIPKDEADADVLHDIEKVLNLNNKALVQRRQALFDAVKDKLKQEFPQKVWTQKLFDKHQEEWLARHYRKGKQAFRPYCMAAVWFLDLLSQQPRYQ